MQKNYTHKMLGNLYLYAKIQPLSIAMQICVDVSAELLVVTRAAQN